MRSKKRLAGLTGAVAGALLIAGCSSPQLGGAASASGSAKGPFTIGVSNAFIGSEYRTQMIQAIQDTFNEYKAQGVVDQLVQENGDTDINGQIQQIRNLINRGVDAIIVDPNSASALDGVFKEATDRGIKVYAIDQAVDAPNVLNVGISQQDLGRVSAEWFVKQVGNNAKVVTVEGAAGNPATDARWAGAEPVFNAAGIQVLTRGDGGWDQTTGQTVATNLLATYKDIKGIWTYDGMAQGVLKAIEASGRTKDVVAPGEARVGYMRMWNDLLSSGFQSIGIINPPGTGATALHFAVNQLQGKQLDPAKVADGHSIVLPLDVPLTNDNFQTLWQQYQSKQDTYVLDSILSADQVAAYFK